MKTQPLTNAPKRKHRQVDPDMAALEACCRALERCRPAVLEATLRFLWDRYLINPPKPHEDAKPD